MYICIYIDIGNLLGRFIKSDSDKKEQGVFTYARICVEIDLIKGLHDILHMKHEFFNWNHILDYENTAFRCKLCHLMGHLQDSCPLPKKFTKKKKGKTTNRKNWKTDYVPPLDEDEESDDEEQPDLHKNEENVKKTESVDAQTLGKKNYGVETLTNVVNPIDVSLSGLNCAHETESSVSDKEQVIV